MLVYIGGGWLPGVPARDLLESEVKEHGREFLLQSGLYIEPAPSAPKSKKEMSNASN